MAITARPPANGVTERTLLVVNEIVCGISFVVVNKLDDAKDNNLAICRTTDNELADMSDITLAICLINDNISDVVTAMVFPTARVSVIAWALVRSIVLRYNCWALIEREFGDANENTLAVRRVSDSDSGLVSANGLLTAWRRLSVSGDVSPNGLTACRNNDKEFGSVSPITRR